MDVLKISDMLQRSQKTEQIFINPFAHKFLFYPGNLKRERVRYIMIHHAAARTCSAKDIHEWHLARTDGGQWAGAGYNFFVRKDGSLWEMRGLTIHGSHGGPDWNPVSIGICYEGNYDVETTIPTAQWNAGIKLCAMVMHSFPNIEFNPGRIIGHSDTSAKACPGRYFSMANLRNGVKSKLAATDSVFSNIKFDTAGTITSSFVTYEVKLGDTWESIALKFFTTANTLKAMNLSDQSIMYNTLKPGRKLNIPNSYPTKALSSVKTMTDRAIYTQTDAEVAFNISIADDVIFGSGSASTGFSYSGSAEVSGDSSYIEANQGLSKPYLSKIEAMEKVQYGNPSSVRRDIDPVKSLLEYDKFKIMVEMKDHVASFMFKIDPINTSETRSRNLSEIKTKGGSIIADGGGNFPTKTISGFMLGYNGTSEKLDFINFYKRYIESGNYKSIHLEFQGVLSMIEIKNLSTSESSNDSVLTSYNMSIMILSENTGQSGEEYVDNTAFQTSNETYYPSSLVNSLSYGGGRWRSTNEVS